MLRGSGRRLGSAPGAALRRLRQDRVRRADRQERRLLRPLSGAHRGDAAVAAHHPAVPGADAGRAGQGQRPQGRAAAARRDEAVDGSADPSLQALHRGLSRAGRRDLHRGRGAEGRVRRLSRRRRHQPAVSLQDPRAGLCLPAGDRVHVARATCWPIWSRSSARWTSCSARSTDEHATSRGRPFEQPASISSSRRKISKRPRSTSPNTRRGGRRARCCRCSIWRSASRRLAAAGGDGPRRRDARHGADPRLRGRDLLHDVQPAAGRALPAAGLHDDAVLAARLGRGGRGLREEARHRRRRHAPRTGCSPWSRSNASAPASTRRSCRSTTISTRISTARRPRRCSTRCAAGTLPPMGSVIGRRRLGAGRAARRR